MNMMSHALGSIGRGYTNTIKVKVYRLTISISPRSRRAAYPLDQLNSAPTLFVLCLSVVLSLSQVRTFCRYWW
jgi:hypothetical protein